MMTSSEVLADLELIDIGNGRKASVKVLKRLLPDVETTLFFAKALRLDIKQLTELLIKVHNGMTVVEALFNQGHAHSETLQSYVVDVAPPALLTTAKRPTFSADVVDPDAFLPAFWDALEVTVAKSISEVAVKLAGVLDALPSKEGEMTFVHMAKLNKQRPTIGVYGASIVHKPVLPVLVILDVSGSMSESTVRAIAADVVALGYKASASLAIVSDTARMWEAGNYGVDDVLRNAEYSGTRYETLAPLFQGRDWGTVITIADYDSSTAAAQHIRDTATGRIGRVLDLSLVNRPTYLAECVGQLADEVQPLLIGNSGRVL